MDALGFRGGGQRFADIIRQRIIGDPFGINNMYVALATPAIIMVIDRLIPNKSQPSPAPVEQRGV